MSTVIIFHSNTTRLRDNTYPFTSTNNIPIEYHSPSALGDHHLRPQLVELFPKVLSFQRDLRVVHNPVLLGLDCPQRPHHRRMVIVRGHRRQDHVLRRRVRVPGQRVVRVRVVDLRDQRSRVAAVRVLAAERRQRRRREVARRSGRRSGRRRRAASRRQQRADAEVRLARQLQERVVGHRALQFRV